MTPLAMKIRALIEEQGPIPVSTYMALCLGDPEYGYYITRDPLGSSGDFTTAPEISQLFGELIGAALGDFWLRSGKPTPVVLAEYGPGRGTLMRDVLRVLQKIPGFVEAASLHMIETSPVLRAAQKRALQTARLPQYFHESDESLPDGFRLLIANEFFDALPIDQIECRGGIWHQRLIGLDGAGCLSFGLGAPAGTGLPKAPDGTVVEVSPARSSACARMAMAIARHGGLLLAIDYGDKAGTGDTLQAVRAHQSESPFANPGNADLTTQVDFTALHEAARANGARTHGPMTQGDFLLRLGLLERAGQLGAGKDEAIQNALRAAVERLASPAHMGNLFKVLAVCSGDQAPAPFAA